jgi:hypothetical protein
MDGKLSAKPKSDITPRHETDTDSAWMESPDKRTGCWMKRCLASLAIFATDLNLRARILSLSSLFSRLPLQVTGS